jgi:hypothetical protein
MSSTDGNYLVRFNFDNGNPGPGHSNEVQSLGPTSKERAVLFFNDNKTHKHIKNLVLLEGDKVIDTHP